MKAVDSQKVDYREIASLYKPLFLDYLHRFERLAPFFSADPSNPSAWSDAARQVTAHPRQRAAVVGSLRRLNRSLGADQAALSSLDALEEGALAIVTGQQVGVLGGPLYTLYKAVTAVELGHRASSMLGRPVVALFWMDSDDHDFDEVRSVRLVDSSHELLTLSYETQAAEQRIPVAWHRLETSVEEMIARAGASLAESEFRAEVLESLGECYRPGRSMTEAFGSWLLRLTRGLGLAIVDPSAAELKALAAPLFEREAREDSESSRRVQETTEKLLALGYHAQTSVTPGRLNLFYAGPDRFHIASRDSRFQITGDGRSLSAGELASLIRSEPERFSPNVVLRPLYQDSLLPTLAYVAGPNELAYYAQLRGVYQHFDLPMPIIFPRASFTVVEKAHARFLRRYGVKLSELKADNESTLNHILKEQAAPQLEHDLSRARSCIQEIMQALTRDLSSVDPTLVPTVRSTQGKLLHLLEELEAKALRAIKRKDETLRRQFFSARTALFPGFELQERQLSPLQYLTKYGWAFVEMVRESVDLKSPAHFLLYP